MPRSARFGKHYADRELDTLTLPANAHLSFVLGNQSNDKYPATANICGTVEFDTPPGEQISVVGIRANGQALTTLPALVQ